MGYIKSKRANKERENLSESMSSAPRTSQCLLLYDEPFCLIYQMI